MLSRHKQCAAIDSYAKVGTHIVFLSPHFANPPILGVIPLSQMCDFLGVPKYNFLGFIHNFAHFSGMSVR